MINMKEFYQREKAQEESGTMYCLELPQNAEDSKQYCIDSGFKGNHARFINHSVCTWTWKIHLMMPLLTNYISVWS